MKLGAGIILGITLVIIWAHTWRALLGWALSRGDTPPNPHRGQAVE